MDAPQQDIQIDRARKLVEVRVKGFVTAEDASWLAEETRGAIRTLGKDVGKHVTLYDFSELRVSPGDTVDAVKAMYANPAVRPVWARKVAMVTQSALARRQFERLREAREDIAIFDTRDAALAWLLAA